MRIERATSQFRDWDAVGALILRAFAYMDGRIDPPSSAFALTPETMAAEAAKGALLLARDDDKLVGCVFAYPKGDALYIAKLAVLPGLQRAGIGRLLVEEVRADARKRGFLNLELQTRIELKENHIAFGRMGFVKIAETAHPGYSRPTSITMHSAVTA
jgi:GNAT superfamily N-acetyltransferase